LEAQLAKMRTAFEFAVAELGTDQQTIFRRIEQNEKPRPRTDAASTASSSSTAASGAAATAETASSSAPSSGAAAASSSSSSDAAAGGDAAKDGDDKQLKTTFGAQVLYDYNARKDYELTIHVNEIITVLSQHENGWWLGCNHAGKQGYFPGSYVRALT
jgi:uncharacterized protein (DUF2147 family)